MSALPWWHWALAAAGLAVAELHWPGSYLIWIALGAGVTGALSAAGAADTLNGQLVVLAPAVAASCVLGWWVYRVLPRPREDATSLNLRTRQLIGARGVVCEALRHGQGKVRLGDSQWLAEGPDLPVGDAVVVAAVRGSRVIVKAAGGG